MKSIERDRFIETLKERVDQCLAATGLSAREASLKASGGQTDQVIPGIRKGNIPNSAWVAGLARTFQCSTDYLLGIENPANSGTIEKGGSPALNRYRRIRHIEDELRRLDIASIRPLRSIASGGDQLDRERLASIESAAQDLRSELRSLTA